MMRKKLKITEEQLKRLVSLKNQMSENMDDMSHEGQMNEIGVGSVEMGLAGEIAPYVIEKLKDMGIVDISGLNLEIFTKALRHEITNYKEDKDEEYGDMPGFEGTMDDLNNLSIRQENTDNQVYESIRNNFKRFL
jgi:hypothetical protein